MIEVAGQTKHVTSYLRDFLFDDVKMTQRVYPFGGEQNRLLLAKLFAKPHNFLVLDEPTNDLDIETLELLQEVIADYDGTILIVSHDRDFLDRTVTGILAFEGNAKITFHAGGYSDYLNRKNPSRLNKTKSSSRKAEKIRIEQTQPNRPARLGFRDKHLLDTLPNEIAALELEIANIEGQLAVLICFKLTSKFSDLANKLTMFRDQRREKKWNG